MAAFSAQRLLKCELAFTSPAVADSYHGAAGMLPIGRDALTELTELALAKRET